MAGTVRGGRLAAATNKQKYGADFYVKIGALGGEKGNTGGVYNNPKKAREIGALGGKLSKRGYKYVETKDGYKYYINNKTLKTERFSL